MLLYNNVPQNISPAWSLPEWVKNPIMVNKIPNPSTPNAQVFIFPGTSNCVLIDAISNYIEC